MSIPRPVHTSNESNLNQMDFKEISELIKLVGKSNLIELKIKQGDFEIELLTDRHGKSQRSGAVERLVTVSQEVAQPAAVLKADTQARPAVAVEAQPSVVETNPEGANLLEIRSPMVGTFYRSSGPDKPPFVKVGDTIQKGSIVCIIEAMKLFNEIESEITGKVVQVLVTDAAPVEYDQVLFLVEA